jgi:hypothetical protein
MSKKPYRFEKQEWMELSQRKDWNDSTVNPDDLAEYSEFQRPYALPKGEDSYPAWEWGWPDIEFPDIPPIIYPDPIDHPCSIDENCEWAGIIGPDEMECGDCYTFTQAHIWYGCDIAPWWAAYGSWELKNVNTVGGTCYQLFTGPIMTTVCCDETVESGNFTVVYNGVLDCKGSKDVLVTCDLCCNGEDGIVLTGADTVAAAATWTGTITPACPNTTCEVTSNSGCSLSCTVNAEGSQVTVTPGASDCGSFTVTVTDPGGTEQCPAGTSSKTVRITGGGASWQFVQSAPADCQGCDCGCSGTVLPYTPCINEGLKYGTNNGGTFDCSIGYGYNCKTLAGCTVGPGSWPPCHSGGGSECSGACLGPCGSEAPCIDKVWHECEWKCSC